MPPSPRSRPAAARRLAAIAVLVLACGDDPVGPLPVPEGAAVRIVAREGPHRPGALLTLTFENVGDEDLTYTACLREVQQRVDGQWHPVPEPLRDCGPQTPLPLPAGADATVTGDLPPELAAGTYRFLWAFFPPGAAPRHPVVPTHQASNAFEVEP